GRCVPTNPSLPSIRPLQGFIGPGRSVFGYSHTLAHRMETEDVGVAVLRFANGALGTIAATTGAYPGISTRIEIYGDRGSAVIEDDHLSYLHLARDDREEVGPYGVAAGKRAQRTESAETSAAQDPAALAIRSHA